VSLGDGLVVVLVGDGEGELLDGDGDGFVVVCVGVGEGVV
jgi:hypothetical protein